MRSRAGISQKTFSKRGPEPVRGGNRRGFLGGGDSDFWAKNGVGWEIWRENYGDFLLDLGFWVKNGDLGGCDWTPGF